MPETIEQKLGLDVGDALAALAQLDAKFSAFGSQLTTLSNQIGGFNAQAQQLVAALGGITRAADSTSMAMAKVAKMPKLPKVNLPDLDEPKRRLQSFTLSWQTMARIMMTQAIVRSINMIRDGIAEATESAIEFSKRMSEIGAIDPSRNFQQISASVRQMSDAFNQPLNTVAESQYQLLSSQFVTAADSVNILTAAYQLSKVSAQDFGAVTLLITGSLNAYGESSDRAELRAAQFFETIKLGRIRAEELGTALGRIQTVGHELGASLEELDASLAAITIGGVKSTEAGTQLRGMMSALLKPSEEMKKALAGIGVESGTEAVAAYGLIGAWKKLVDSVGGSNEQIAKLDPNIRGMTGVMRLAGEGFKQFTANMEELRRATQDTLKNPLENIKATDAEKVTTAYNKLKNTLTTDIGMKFLSGLRRELEGLQGIMDHFADPQAKVRAKAGSEMESHKQYAEAEIREGERKNEELTRGLRQYIAESKIGYLKDAANFKEAMKVEEQVVKLSCDQIMRTRQKLTQELFAESEASLKRLADLPNQIKAAQDKTDDRLLARKIQSSDPSQRFDMEKREAWRLAEEANKQQGSATDEKQLALAEATRQRSESWARMAVESAKVTGDADQQWQAQRMMDDLDDSRIKGMKAEEVRQKEVATTTEARGHQAEQHNIELEEQRRAIEAKYKDLAKADIGSDKYKETLNEISQMTTKFISNLAETTKGDFLKNILGDPKAFQSIMDEAQRSLGSFYIKKIEMEPATIVKMKEGLQQGLNELKLQCPALEAIIKVTGVVDPSGAVAAFEKRMNEKSSRSFKQAQGIASGMAVTDEYRRGTEGLDTLMPKYPLFQPAQNEMEKVKTWKASFDGLMQSADMSEAKLTRLGQLFGEINLKKAFPVSSDRARADEAVQTMNDALEKRKQLQDQQKSTEAPKGVSDADTQSIELQIRLLEQRKAALDQVKKVTLDSSGASADLAGSLSAAAQTDFSDVINQINNAVSAMNTLSSVPRMSASGGIAYHSTGGRGTDVIPAMLSPGEFVMSASATNRFYSQLVAMNSGIQPTFRSEGGGITNIGDINVTVNGGGSSRQTGRSIAAELRRELRRGTSTL